MADRPRHDDGRPPRQTTAARRATTTAAGRRPAVARATTAPTAGMIHTPGTRARGPMAPGRVAEAIRVRAASSTRSDRAPRPWETGDRSPAAGDGRAQGGPRPVLRPRHDDRPRTTAPPRRPTPVRRPPPRRPTPVRRPPPRRPTPVRRPPPRRPTPVRRPPPRRPSPVRRPRNQGPAPTAPRRAGRPRPARLRPGRTVRQPPAATDRPDLAPGRRRGAGRRPSPGRGGVRRATGGTTAARRAPAPACTREARPPRHVPAHPGPRGGGRHAHRGDRLRRPPGHRARGRGPSLGAPRTTSSRRPSSAGRTP